LKNNTGYDDHCGGVYLGGFVTITRNTITGNRLQNTYGWGGGVLILGTAYMSHNILKDNYCPSYGGALFVDEGGIAYLDNELIFNNSTALYGAGVALDNGAPGSSYVYMTNCTVANNHSPDSAGNGVYVDVSSFCTMKNCIFTGNRDDFFVNAGSSLTATYTLSQEGITGQGNFTADPLFADSANGDFHLRSKGGRYDPIGQGWVTDSVHSPAIDAGDSTSSFNNEPSPNGSQINLGCYGNTAYASKSLNNTGISNSIQQRTVNFILYPNPGSGNFMLEMNGAQLTAGELMIYDVIGKMVFRSALINIKTEINTGLPAGLYFYRVNEQGNVVGNGKLVIQEK
jgi:hypothetical protein